MADIEAAAWSETAASNIQPSPDGWPPNSSPNIVYTTDREMMGAIKRDWNRRNATVTSGGSANAQTLSYTQGPTAYVRGQQFTFIAGFGNTGPLTVAVGGLAATAVQSQGVALTGGEIKAGQIVELMFDGTQFQIISGQGTFLPVSGPGLAGGTTGGLYNDVGRNKLHNAMFRIQQRGTGPFTVTAVYSADRWMTGFNLDTYSLTFTNFVSDGQRTIINDEEAYNTATVSVTGNAGAASYSLLEQRIENVRRLGNKTVTLSFWAWSGSGTPKIGVSFDQSFGTGGSPSATVQMSGQAVTISTTIARYSLTFILPSLSGKTVGTNGDDYTRLMLWFSSGSTQASRAGNIGVQSAAFGLWGMQLEIGSVATPLEKIDIAVDTVECKRFYHSGSFNLAGNTGAGTTLITRFPFPVPMRATPIMTPNFVTQTNCGSSSMPAVDGSHYQINTAGTAAGGFVINGSFTASADL